MLCGECRDNGRSASHLYTILLLVRHRACSVTASVEAACGFAEALATAYSLFLALPFVRPGFCCLCSALVSDNVHVYVLDTNAVIVAVQSCY